MFLYLLFLYTYTPQEFDLKTYLTTIFIYTQTSSTTCYSYKTRKIRELFAVAFGRLSYS